MNQKGIVREMGGGEFKLKAPNGKGMDEKSLLKHVRKLCMFFVLPN